MEVRASGRIRQEEGDVDLRFLEPDAVRSASSPSPVAYRSWPTRRRDLNAQGFVEAIEVVEQANHRRQFDNLPVVEVAP